MPGCRILIVDDDAESRSLLSEVLESNGFSTTAVSDSKAAQETFDRGPAFGMVIADLRMPGGNGLDLLSSIRKRHSRVSIVLMSSFIAEAQRRVAHELGVDALLEKPFRLTELIKTVTAIAENRSVGVGG